MIVVALSVLLLRLAAHNLIVYNIEHNQALAQMNLKLLSKALENYAKDNRSQYPEDIKELTRGEPAYLERNYVAASSIRGYEYDCQRLDAAGYNCYATPLDCKFSGKMVYSVSTGGGFIAEKCDSK